jgi:hypothetical protein
MARTCLFSHSLLQMRMGECVCAVSFCPTRDDVCDVSSRTRLGTQPGGCVPARNQNKTPEQELPAAGMWRVIVSGRLQHSSTFVPGALARWCHCRRTGTSRSSTARYFAGFKRKPSKINPRPLGEMALGYFILHHS